MKRSVLMLWIMAAGTCRGAPTNLMIALYNYAGVPPEVLEPAMKMTDRALGHAGIVVEWSFCPASDEQEPRCSRPLLGQRYVVMNILAARGGSVGEIAGFAIFDSARIHGARAFAFWDMVKVTASRARRRPGMVLGCVVVHEIAHTLGLRHGDTGVMQAMLHPQDMDDATQGLAFSAAEARRLRKAVESMKPE